MNRQWFILILWIIAGTLNIVGEALREDILGAINYGLIWIVLISFIIKDAINQEKEAL
jgi:hypothetical protein